MDFRKGDKVWSTKYGNGVVDQVCDTEIYNYPVEVKFKDDENEYTTGGLHYWENPLRELFHGHDLKVVGEVLPKRSVIKYINYYHIDGNVYGPYKSKEIADEDLRLFGQTLAILVPE